MSSVLNKISHAFPPPKFLYIPYTGIHITDTHVRCIQFIKKGKNISIGKYKEVALRQGTVVGGQIMDLEEVSLVLSKIKDELGFDVAKLSLPEEKGYLFTAKIPIVSEKEIRSAIESKMEENVPVSPTDLSFDYRLFERSDKDLIGVVVSAMPNSIIDSYLAVAQKSGISLLSLEIESQAMARSISPKGFGGTCLIINFHIDKVGLYVATNGLVRFTSTIQTKGEASNNPGFLMQEIKKLYIYWHTLKENVDNSERKISQIYICGDGFDDELTAFVASHSKTPTFLANVWVNILDINNDIPKISFTDSLKFSCAIGLAIPSEIYI